MMNPNAATPVATSSGKSGQNSFLDLKTAFERFRYHNDILYNNRSFTVDVPLPSFDNPYPGNQEDYDTDIRYMVESLLGSDLIGADKADHWWGSEFDPDDKPGFGSVLEGWDRYLSNSNLSVNGTVNKSGDQRGNRTSIESTALYLIMDQIVSTLFPETGESLAYHKPGFQIRVALLADREPVVQEPGPFSLDYEDSYLRLSMTLVRWQPVEGDGSIEYSTGVTNSRITVQIPIGVDEGTILVDRDEWGFGFSKNEDPASYGDYQYVIDDFWDWDSADEDSANKISAKKSNGNKLSNRTKVGFNRTKVGFTSEVNKVLGERYYVMDQVQERYYVMDQVQLDDAVKSVIEQF